MRLINLDLSHYLKNRTRMSKKYVKLHTGIGLEKLKIMQKFKHAVITKIHQSFVMIFTHYSFDENRKPAYKSR
ncbi:hypothetical protein B0181_07530 [Moraxella caviae]|uniref:Uncharacterized protein n=1 Tax=Moraxella caviae TaxID=34060 RepID=A0A1S9ZZT0_9GAMM|nr:hypothetical protein B0181_07530 [Moraxella caviae]